MTRRSTSLWIACLVLGGAPFALRTRVRDAAAPPGTTRAASGDADAARRTALQPRRPAPLTSDELADGYIAAETVGGLPPPLPAHLVATPVPPTNPALR